MLCTIITTPGATLFYLCLLIVFGDRNIAVVETLLQARRNEKEMKVKPATSFKLLTIFIHKK